MVLITNGREETQNAKIDALGIRSYFDIILISDSYSPPQRKPNVGMFEEALSYFSGTAKEMVYIGDDEIRDGASELVGIKFINIKNLDTKKIGDKYYEQ